MQRIFLKKENSKKDLEIDTMDKKQRIQAVNETDIVKHQMHLQTISTFTTLYGASKNPELTSLIEGVLIKLIKPFNDNV